MRVCCDMLSVGFTVLIITPPRRGQDANYTEKNVEVALLDKDSRECTFHVSVKYYNDFSTIRGVFLIQSSAASYLVLKRILFSPNFPPLYTTEALRIYQKTVALSKMLVLHFALRCILKCMLYYVITFCIKSCIISASLAKSLVR